MRLKSDGLPIARRCKTFYINMDLSELRGLLVAFLLIGFGLFIRSTKNENYLSAKKWWKILVTLGLVYLTFKVVLLIMKWTI